MLMATPYTAGYNEVAYALFCLVYLSQPYGSKDGDSNLSE